MINFFQVKRRPDKLSQTVVLLLFVSFQVNSFNIRQIQTLFFQQGVHNLLRNRGGIKQTMYIAAIEVALLPAFFCSVDLSEGASPCVRPM